MGKKQITKEAMRIPLSGLGQLAVQGGALFFVFAVLLGLFDKFQPEAQRKAVRRANASLQETVVPTPPVDLPDLSRMKESSFSGIRRLANLHTEFPERPNVQIQQYIVQEGDTPWSIGEKFGLQPESILWANEGLSAEAGSLTISTTLNILPVDGVMHMVAEGDTIEGVASQHGVTVDAIADYVGNNLPLIPPYELAPGQQVIVPGGTKPIVWQDPGPAVIAGMGRKSPGFYSGNLVNIGTGYFVWPTAAPIVLTQQYWGAHPAIDIDTYYRQPIFAADSGTVIYSDWSSNGYGNLVIIDHGNGLWTYYAHNSFNLVSVGQGVVQGQQVAESGSTGNSTGDHLDFRIRVDGGSFLNPMDYLP